MTLVPLDAAPHADDRLLPWKRVRDLTGLSRTTAWRRQKAGDFPAPVVISPGRVGWREREVAAWAASRTPRSALPAAPSSTRPAAGDAGVAVRPAAAAASPARRPTARRRSAAVEAPDQMSFNF